jgi:hypothetical protein
MLSLSCTWAPTVSVWNMLCWGSKPACWIGILYLKVVIFQCFQCLPRQKERTASTTGQKRCPVSQFIHSHVGTEAHTNELTLLCYSSCFADTPVHNPSIRICIFLMSLGWGSNNYHAQNVLKWMLLMQQKLKTVGRIQYHYLSHSGVI